jgi:NADPH-dependent 2,4-dienoyl-CoA reductase/sulfur reductase-like enzyme
VERVGKALRLDRLIICAFGDSSAIVLGTRRSTSNHQVPRFVTKQHRRLTQAPLQRRCCTMSKVIVVGAGINGVTAAIELKKRGHNVTLVDPGPLPHPLAASTDISKAVRRAYGADEDYTDLAERSIGLWRKWNEEFGVA